MLAWVLSSNLEKYLTMDHCIEATVSDETWKSLLPDLPIPPALIRQVCTCIFIYKFITDHWDERSVYVDKFIVCHEHGKWLCQFHLSRSEVDNLSWADMSIIYHFMTCPDQTSWFTFITFFSRLLGQGWLLHPSPWSVFTWTLCRIKCKLKPRGTVFHFFRWSRLAWGRLVVV